MPRSVQESVKGAAVLSTLEFVGAEHGDVELARALGSLDPEVRRSMTSCAPTSELPYEHLSALWESIDATLHEVAPDWIERSGAHSIQSRGTALYGGILRKSSPTEFLTQSVSLFRLFYSPGDMVVVEDEPGRAVLRLDGFDGRTRLFCRRQTGGLGRALEIAGGERPAVSHVRCVNDGDAFCEWELSWLTISESAKRESPARGLRLQP